MHRLSDYATAERQNVAGADGWVIFGDPQRGRWVTLTDAEAEALVAAIAPELIRACHAALPLVGALCGALAETCDEEAADTLGLLRNVTAAYPNRAP